MQDFNNGLPKINYPIVIFVIFQLFLVITAIMSIISIVNKGDKIDPDDFSIQPSIKIANLTQTISDFPESNIDILQSLLLDIAQTNDSNINTREAQAEIRNGTATSLDFPLQNLHYYSAIVDIPEISQSYQFFYQYSKDPDNKYLDPNDSIAFLCVKDLTQIIYSDFSCIDTYSQLTRNSIVAKYLNFFNFSGFGAGVDSNNSSQINITILDPSITDEIQAIAEIQQTVQSLGMSPDLFQYNVLPQKDFTYYIAP